MSTSTIVQIKSFSLSVASNKTFNEWKGNIFLYKQNGTMAVDLRFVDDPDFFSQFESVNPQGCSQIYTSFSHFPIYAELLQGSKSVYVQLNEGVSAGFAKMILSVRPLSTTQRISMSLQHHIDPISLQRTRPATMSRSKKKK
jgi:hypothetical protein